MRLNRIPADTRIAWALTGAAALGIVAVFAVLRWSQTTLSATDRTLPTAAGHNYQIVLVARSTCSACQDPMLPEAVETIVARAEYQAGLSSEPITTLAIMTDMDHQVGTAFMGRFGDFDEVALGGGWDNTLLRQVQEKGEDKVLATPALYVIRRTMRNRNNGTGLTFGGDTVLYSVIGAETIKRFARNLDSIHTIRSDSMVGVSVPTEAIDSAALIQN